MVGDRTPWTVLQHVAWEGPGLIASEAHQRGRFLHVCRLDLGDPVPAARDLAGLIVMGGPMGVYEADVHPHLTAECDLLREAVTLGIPVLGICLGAQLLAAALGARVYKGPGSEVGPGRVILTPEGLADPVLGGLGSQLPVMHWHGDTFDLPQGAALLASSARYPHQGFRAGRHAYAFQFHVEVDHELAGAWAPHLPPGLAPTAPDRRAIEAAGRSIIGRFFDAAP